MPMRTPKENRKRYSIGALTDPADEGIDVGIEAWTTALEKTIDVWRREGSKTGKPTRPSGRSLRDLRQAGVPGEEHRGLLLLYPLSPSPNQREAVVGWDKPIIGFAASFPSSEQEVSVEYKVDHLLWEEQYGSAD